MYDAIYAKKLTRKTNDGFLKIKILAAAKLTSEHHRITDALK